MIMSTQNSDADGFTTVCVRKSTKRRLESLKPFESLSWTEFMEEMAETYEDTGES